MIPQGAPVPIRGAWLVVADDATGIRKITRPTHSGIVTSERPYGSVEKIKRSAHLVAERAKETADAARELADLVGEAIVIDPPVTRI